MSSATDELRRLLDERGVKYRAIGDATFWETHDGAFRYKAESHAEKLMVMTCCSQKCTVMTPEQAIAATLGRGTCHITPQFTCSKCEYQYPTRNYECYETCDGRTAYASLGCDVLDCEKPNYCPNCGRKVVLSE